MEVQHQGDKEEAFIQIGRRARDGQQVEGTCHKAAAGRPSKVVECGAGWAKLQLANKAAADGQGGRAHNPEFQRGKIKPQNTD